MRTEHPLEKEVDNIFLIGFPLPELQRDGRIRSTPSQGGLTRCEILWRPVETAEKVVKHENTEQSMNWEKKVDEEKADVQIGS